MENDIKKRIPPWSENVEKYRISTEYTLIFYTTPHYAVFRYYYNSETYLCETHKSTVLWWISPEEKWETLCRRIEEYENLEQDMCYEKTIGV